MPSAWRWIFWVEIPLMTLTVLYWLIRPIHYLRNIVGIGTPTQADRFLLTLYAGVTLTLAGYYAFLLAEVPLTDLTFLVFEVVLLFGDLFIIGATIVYMKKVIWNWGLVTQVIMAFLWGAYRVVFLAVVWP